MSFFSIDLSLPLPCRTAAGWTCCLRLLECCTDLICGLTSCLVLSEPRQHCLRQSSSEWRLAEESFPLGLGVISAGTMM